jgi:hypothetical protein
MFTMTAKERHSMGIVSRSRVRGDLRCCPPAALAAAVVLGLAVGCGGSKSSDSQVASSASTKKCLEQHNIAVDSSGKRLPLAIPSGIVDKSLVVLEFEIPVKGVRRSDKATLFFFAGSREAAVGMEQVEAQEAVFVARAPAADRPALRRLLRASYEQRQNVVVGWANFGGTSGSRRLVNSCLRG